MEKVKLGLALSGGGACGAYEVGAIKVLAKMGFEPRAVAGSSIGALNGAVVSAFRIKKAAARLEKIWLDLYTEKVLQPRQRPLPVKTVRPAGIRRGHLRLRRPAKISPPETTGDFFTRLRQLLTDKAFAIYDETPLDNIINSAINLKRLYRGKEFYASAFPGSQGLTGAVADLFYWLLARGKSEFFHIQSLSPDKILTVLKASAAVPWLFQPSRSTAGTTGTGALAAGTGEISPSSLLSPVAVHTLSPLSSKTAAAWTPRTGPVSRWWRSVLQSKFCKWAISKPSLTFPRNA